MIPYLTSAIRGFHVYYNKYGGHNLENRLAVAVIKRSNNNNKATMYHL